MCCDNFYFTQNYCPFVFISKQSLLCENIFAIYLSLLFRLILLRSYFFLIYKKMIFELAICIRTLSEYLFSLSQTFLSLLQSLIYFAADFEICLNVSIRVYRYMRGDRITVNDHSRASCATKPLATKSASRSTELCTPRKRYSNASNAAKPSRDPAPSALIF